MKNKKLLWLVIGLVSVSVVLSACNSAKDSAEPQETVTEAPAETVPVETEAPVDTLPTEAEPTQPEETTEPEETEETEASDDTTTPNVNTGTGGEYDPGDSTEPEDSTEPTEPVIEVPAPGSENNAYYEYVQNGAGKFSTVKIPAGGTVHYRLKTSGTFLRVEGEGMAVVYNGQTYEAQEGLIEVELPADESQDLKLQFVNNGAEDQGFSVKIQDAVGSESNPIAVESLEEVLVELAENDVDGLYYSWTADKAGDLKLKLSGNIDAEVNVIVNTVPVQLTQQWDDSFSTAVRKNDQILIQVQATPDAEGNVPAGQVKLTGYIAETVTLKITAIPMDAETVSIPAGQSVYYRITGGKNKQLTISAENILVHYHDEVIEPNENGELVIKLTEAAAVLELVNTGAEASTYPLNLNFPIGHKQNPVIVTELGELPVELTEEDDGYYFSYQTPDIGMLIFSMWSYPELDDAKTNVTLINETTRESASLWTVDSKGQEVENENISLMVSQGDKISIQVTVKNTAGRNLAAQLAIYGQLYGSEEVPIVVNYPGFTAKVPAGKTLYYEGYNLGGMLMDVAGTDFILTHNGEQYQPVDGLVHLTVVADGRMPAKFGITNTGEADAAIEATFTYPIGHSENPDKLMIGTNTVNRDAGDSEYYFTFTAPRAGTLTVKFDSNAQWLYAVDNLTQGMYGDTQWSDSDPLMTETTVTVAAKDIIRVRVNTYDAANSFETPAGTVNFQVSYITGPTEITNFAMPVYADLLSGESADFIGNFYGYVLRVTGNKNTTVEFNGTVYTADSTGVVKVDMPKSGSDMLTIRVHNGAAQNGQFTVLFSTTSTGSAENPEKLTLGSHSMVQSVEGGGDYYYQFVAESNGRLVITFETDVDAIFIVNNTQVYYTHLGKNRVSLTVRAGAKVNLVVNTYDPNDPMVSPVGTVDFTVEMQ